MSLYKSKFVNIQFKVRRYDSEDKFFYKEWVYDEVNGFDVISSEIDGSPHIKMKLRNYEGHSRDIVLFPKHRNMMVKALNKIIKIFTDYESMTKEERNKNPIYTMIEGNITINLKYRAGIAVNIYGDTTIYVKPVVITNSGQNFPGISISYKNEATFRFLLGEVQEMAAAMEEVNFHLLGLQLLQFSPPVRYGKYTVKLNPGYQEKSSVSDPNPPVRRSPFDNVRTK